MSRRRGGVRIKTWPRTIHRVYTLHVPKPEPKEPEPVTIDCRLAK